MANRFVLFILSAVVGVSVALATVGLIELIAWVQWLGFGAASESEFASIAEHAPGWRVVVAPTLGGLIVGVTLFLLPGRRYHGIADVMEACAFNSGRMGVRSGLSAVFATGVSLGCGAPLGREGPAVHIGASISAWMAERLGLNRSQSLALLGCGAAAAVTTSFNAPIAGVLFALEVIVGYYTLQVFAPVVVASLIAVVVRGFFIDNQPIFDLPQYTLNSLWEMPLFAILGILSAFLVSAFIYLVGQTRQLWHHSGAPDWLRPAVAGLLIGVIALYFPRVVGIGYESVYAALTGTLPVSLLMQLLVIKTLVIIFALASGFAGGVFGPAVFIGAMLGGLFSGFLTGLGLDAVSLPGVYAIVGIAGVASAMLGAPISTVLIVFELTRSYEITIAVMLSAAFASTIMQLGSYTSFFRWQLSQRGVNISSGRDTSLLMTHTVADLVSDHFTRVAATLCARDVESQLGFDRRRVAVVFDAEDRFAGSTELRELVAHSIENGFDQPITDVLRDPSMAINLTTNVVVALQSMAVHDTDYLPVVHRAADDSVEFKGVIFKDDLLTEHYEVIRKAREEEFGVN